MNTKELKINKYHSQLPLLENNKKVARVNQPEDFFRV
jgi:hypothetical protein